MRKRLMPIKTILFAAFTVFILAQCSEDEIAPQQPIEASAEELSVDEAASGSMTISGVYTSYEDVEDCKTCTFVVTEDLTLVDGQDLGLKPGAVICLDKAKRYGDIEFVNLEGTEQNPIKIGRAIFK